MARAQAQFLEVETKGGASLGGFQSFWIDKRVVLPSSSTTFDYQPFDTGVIVTTNTGDNQQLDLSLPGSHYWHRLVEQALEQGHVWTTTIYEFESLLFPEPTFISTDEPGLNRYQLDETKLGVMAQFFGEVVSATSDSDAISLQLGSSLSPVGAQVPPRRFLSSIIGTPLRL